MLDGVEQPLAVDGTALTQVEFTQVRLLTQRVVGCAVMFTFCCDLSTGSKISTATGMAAAASLACSCATWDTIVVSAVFTPESKMMA